MNAQQNPTTQPTTNHFGCGRRSTTAAARFGRRLVALGLVAVPLVALSAGPGHAAPRAPQAVTDPADGYDEGPVVNIQKPTPRRPCTDTDPGWHYRVISKQNNFKVTAKDKFYVDNSDGDGQLTRTVTVSQDTTRTVELSATLSTGGSAGVSIEIVKAEISHSLSITVKGSVTIKKGYSESLTLTVPAHKSAWVATGVQRLKVTGQYVKLDHCGKQLDTKGLVTTYVPLGPGVKSASF